MTISGKCVYIKQLLCCCHLHKWWLLLRMKLGEKRYLNLKLLLFKEESTNTKRVRRDHLTWSFSFADLWKTILYLIGSLLSLWCLFFILLDTYNEIQLLPASLLHPSAFFLRLLGQYQLFELISIPISSQRLINSSTTQNWCHILVDPLYYTLYVIR